MDIEEILEGLEMISTVTPNYPRGCSNGYSYKESEQLVTKAVASAINVLEEYKEIIAYKSNGTPMSVLVESEPPPEE